MKYHNISFILILIC